MEKYNQEKKNQLGMPIGTATARLKKMILFDLIKRLELDKCFICKKKIKTVQELSVEHKIPWLHSDHPIELFFSLENVAFSHLKCNVGARRKLNIAKTVELVCAKCQKKFTGRAFRTRHKIKMGQTDFYCSKSCAAKDIGKGYGRARD